MHPAQPPDPDRSPDLRELEARLRALPQPEIPAGLAARLLAAIPPDRPHPRRRSRTAWLGLTGASAAAASALAVVLLWPPDEPPVTPPVVTRPAPPAETRRPDLADRPFSWSQVRRSLETSEAPAFTWPLDTPSPLGASAAVSAGMLE
jgi:hypothetical protein